MIFFKMFPPTKTNSLANCHCDSVGGHGRHAHIKAIRFFTYIRSAIPSDL